MKFTTPCPSAPPKYTEVPHRLLKLDKAVLPVGAPIEEYNRAVENFSSSITHETQKVYATTARHVLAAEERLGRKFSIPPSAKEQLFFLSYLQGKSLKAQTVSNYMSAFRYVAMSRGALVPLKLTSLASQILAGAANSERNAEKEAKNQDKRAITLEMLSLLSHSIAKREDWSNFEKSLRFAVSLLAFWGTFRLGELLGKTKGEYHSSTSLLASDVTFQDGSVSVWLRNPKVVKEAVGDVVEVWSLPCKPSLDPVKALHVYTEFRQGVFGDAEDLPLFLHETGEIFTKQEMNKDLKALLSIFPELDTSLDKWTGHCFRSGLPTLLSVLGFKGWCPLGLF